MDTKELLDEYLAKHVHMVVSKQTDWQSYTDPSTGKKVWYDQEELWDTFGGNDDPSTNAKSPFEPTGIP